MLLVIRGRDGSMERVFCDIMLQYTANGILKCCSQLQCLQYNSLHRVQGAQRIIRLYVTTIHVPTKNRV